MQDIIHLFFSLLKLGKGGEIQLLQNPSLNSLLDFEKKYNIVWSQTCDHLRGYAGQAAESFQFRTSSYNYY